MKRIVAGVALIAGIAIAAPSVSADVKTTEKVLFSIEGVLGSVVRLFGGKAAKEGVTSTVAVKDDRRISLNDTTGELVDLREEKVYQLDVKKKEYRVRTFAEIRAEFEKAKADAQKQAAEAKPEEKEQMEEAARQLEFEAAVKKTGERKTIAGHDTEQVILTITGHEKGKTLEESGGFVLTSDMWMAPKIAALDELTAFQVKYVTAVYGGLFTAGDAQQMAGLVAIYPSFAKMAEQLRTEGSKLQGTAISTVLTFEGVKSEEQMKAAASQSSNSGGGGVTGGLGGMLARRMGGNRNQPQARTKVMTTTRDVLSISTSVEATDVAIPAGYKEKK
jgi:hypothetical protein